MIPGARHLLRGSSVALFALVNGVAVLTGDGRGAAPLLAICGAMAVAAAAQAVVWGPEGLTPALLLSLPPLLALAAAGPGSWLIGPLAALLLLASELNAAGWEFRGAEAGGLLVRRRVASAARLAGGGIAASVLVMGAAGMGPSIEGTAVVVVAAAALAGSGWIIFGRGE